MPRWVKTPDSPRCRGISDFRGTACGDRVPIGITSSPDKVALRLFRGTETELGEEGLAFAQGVIEAALDAVEVLGMD